MNVEQFLKKCILIVVFICFVTATPALAATSSKQNTSTTAKIEALLKEVAKLKKELALLQGQKTIRTAGSIPSYKTRFYTGKYESLYFVDGDSLLTPKNSEIRAGDQLLWNTFTDIAGRTLDDAQVGEFRIYNDTKTQVSAFVEEKPDNTWIIGFNRQGKNLSSIYNSSAVSDLLVHEYGHIIFFDSPSIQKDFTKTFWGSQKKGEYNATDFVSKYAANNAMEDLAETFVRFIKEEKPTGAGEKFDKIRFLYAYPEMIKLRNELRKTDLF